MIRQSTGLHGTASMYRAQPKIVEMVTLRAPEPGDVVYLSDGTMLWVREDRTLDVPASEVEPLVRNGFVVV